MSQEKQGDLSSVEQMLAKLMSNMESVHAQLRSDFQKLDSKVEAMALKEDIGSALKVKSHRGNRVSFGGGGDQQVSSDEPDTGSSEFKLEGDFRRNSGRFSLGSSSSQTSKDVGTKLERPKFTKKY